MGTKEKRLRPGETPPEPRKAKPNGDTGRSLLDIELALAREFEWKRNLVVFNVHGLSGRLNIQHECDMLVMTKAGYLTEVEIKRTFTDFCADFRKRHHHESHGCDIKEFWYCVPEGIYERCLSKLAEQKLLPTGILCYDEELNFSRKDVRPVRREAPDAVRLYAVDAKPLFLEQQFELARLGAMRQVSLRERIAAMEAGRGDPDGKLLKKLEEKETLLEAYRNAFEEVAGYVLDEKEVLYG